MESSPSRILIWQRAGTRICVVGSFWPIEPEYLSHTYNGTWLHTKQTELSHLPTHFINFPPPPPLPSPHLFAASQFGLANSPAALVSAGLEWVQTVTLTTDKCRSQHRHSAATTCEKVNMISPKLHSLMTKRKQQRHDTSLLSRHWTWLCLLGVTRPNPEVRQLGFESGVCFSATCAPWQAV